MLGITAALYHHEGGNPGRVALTALGLSASTSSRGFQLRCRSLRQALEAELLTEIALRRAAALHPHHVLIQRANGRTPIVLPHELHHEVPARSHLSDDVVQHGAVDLGVQIRTLQPLLQLAKRPLEAPGCRVVRPHSALEKVVVLLSCADAGEDGQVAAGAPPVAKHHTALPGPVDLPIPVIQNLDVPDARWRLRLRRDNPGCKYVDALRTDSRSGPVAPLARFILHLDKDGLPYCWNGLDHPRRLVLCTVAHIRQSEDGLNLSTAHKRSPAEPQRL